MKKFCIYIAIILLISAETTIAGDNPSHKSDEKNLSQVTEEKSKTWSLQKAFQVLKDYIFWSPLSNSEFMKSFYGSKHTETELTKDEKSQSPEEDLLKASAETEDHLPQERVNHKTDIAIGAIIPVENEDIVSQVPPEDYVDTDNLHLPEIALEDTQALESSSNSQSPTDDKDTIKQTQFALEESGQNKEFLPSQKSSIDEELDKSTDEFDSSIEAKDISQNSGHLQENISSAENDEKEEEVAILTQEDAQDAMNDDESKEKREDDDSSQSITLKHGSLKPLDREQVLLEEEKTRTYEQFVQDEIAMLLLPRDEVVLGEITQTGRISYIDSHAYLKVFWREFYHHSREAATISINSHIESLKKTPPVLTLDQSKALSSYYTKRGDIDNLRVTLDNSRINLVRYRDNKFFLLRDAIDADQYNSVYYLIMRNSNIYYAIESKGCMRDEDYINPITLRLLRKKYNRI